MHVNQSGNIKMSITEASKLISEGISVWRADGSPGSLEAIKEKMPLRNNQTLAIISGVNARSIRDARVPSHDGRVFCVTDDCQIDANGGRDAMHAAIRLCDSFRDDNLSSESPKFMEAKLKLRLLFDSNRVWEAAL